VERGAHFGNRYLESKPRCAVLLYTYCMCTLTCERLLVQSTKGYL